jgi:hypothetical protein
MDELEQEQSVTTNRNARLKILNFAIRRKVKVKSKNFQHVTYGKALSLAA